MLEDKSGSRQINYIFAIIQVRYNDVLEQVIVLEVMKIDGF